MTIIDNHCRIGQTSLRQAGIIPNDIRLLVVGLFRRAISNERTAMTKSMNICPERTK